MGVSSGTPPAVTGQQTSNNSLPVVVASDQSSIPVTATIAASQTVGIAAGSATIGALTANQSVNVSQVNGSSAVTSVTGVQDVMPRKRTSTTGLSPNYYEAQLTAKATTTVTASTCYLSALVISVTAAGSSCTLVVEDGQATPVVLVPSFTIAVPTNGNPNVVLQFAEPILMTTGIKIVIAGTTAGTVNVWATYWQ